MKRHLTLAVTLAGLFAAASALPASAQYANEFSPARLLSQGKTTIDIAGSGTVVVQVQVNPDGTHKAIKVIKSTNAGDNDAAMDIAQNSSYRPAHRGTTAVPSFYDFTLKFNGKSVAQSSDLGSGPASPAAAQIAQLLSAGKYAQAKTAAQSAMLSEPDDEIRSLLGTADAQLGQFTDAAAAFDGVGTIAKAFHVIAAQSYANAAVTLATSDPAKAVGYAQKAVQLDPSTNSQYALGVAQVANKQYADAIATLKAVRTKAFADPSTKTNAKVSIDSTLLSAYTQSGDNASATAMVNEIKQLDPSSPVPARVLGNSYLSSGAAAAEAKDYTTALKDFDLAAATGDPQVAVTANVQAAFVVVKTDKPDFKQMQTYAEKALALNAESPEANYAEGIALTGVWASDHQDATKQKALAALTKADQLAKAAGNEALALSIEGFMKQNLKAPSGGGGSSGGRL